MKKSEGKEDGAELASGATFDVPVSAIASDDELAVSLQGRAAAGQATSADHRWLSEYHARKAAGDEEASEDPYSGMDD